eukprot:5760107-Pleurochrysis_carterae.AAC.1
MPLHGRRLKGICAKDSDGAGGHLRRQNYDHEATKKRPAARRRRIPTDEGAADRRADAQIDRSSSASDECTIHVEYKVSHID